MASLIVIATDSRKEMCLQCQHRHDFTIAGSDDDVFLCKERYRSSCSMKSALKNAQATCPHSDIEWAARWNLAALDKQPGCGMAESENLTIEDRQRLEAARVSAKSTGRIGYTKRGGDSKVFKVYQ